MNDLAIMCDEVIGSYNKETKTITTNFDEKKAVCKMQCFYICIFINYCSIIDSCWYLLLSDKILSKTEIFITISRRK